MKHRDFKYAPQKKKRLKLLLTVAAAVAVIVAAAFAVVLLTREKQTLPVDKQQQTQIPAEVVDDLQFTSEKLKDAYEKNGDVVGWLTLKNCDVDNMVFQSVDNDYYLRKNEDGDYDIWGCYFLDYINHASSRDELDRVSIIYGHSLDDYSDSERFSRLKRFKSADFCAENKTINFDLLYEPLEFEIFAACDIPISVDYIDPNPDDPKYLDTLNYMLNNSYYDFGVEVGVNDRILVLSTCTSDENMRFTVAGKLK